MEPAKEEVKSIPANIPAEPKKETKNSFLISTGLGVLGGAAIGFGAYQNIQMKNHYDEAVGLRNKGMKGKEAYLKAQDASSLRNISYAAGGVLLLGGLAVYIWF